MGNAFSRQKRTGQYENTAPRYPHFTALKEVRPGFWNIRAPFYVLNGMVNLGTHMSIVEIGPEKFVALDCVDLALSTALQEINELTDNGRNLVAVIQTHPFHTLAIPKFHAQFPSMAGRRWYGCPRHLIKCTVDANGTDITWAGDLNNCSIRRAFEPHLLMSVPDGCEFIDPKPPTRNHLATVLVLHVPSRTVHVDDCLNWIEDIGLLPRLALGNKTLAFHPSLIHSGLHPTAQAPLDFKRWVQRTLIDNWDYDALVTAHNSMLLQGGKEAVRSLLGRTDAALRKCSIKNALAEAERTAASTWEDAPVVPAAGSSAGPATHNGIVLEDAQCQDCWSNVDIECG